MSKASEKALLDMIDRQRQHTQVVIDRLIEPPRASAQPLSAHQVRIQALDLAVKARGDGMSDDTLVKTAKAFEDFLLGRTNGGT